MVSESASPARERTAASPPRAPPSMSGHSTKGDWGWPGSRVFRDSAGRELRVAAGRATALQSVAPTGGRRGTLAARDISESGPSGWARLRADGRVNWGGSGELGTADDHLGGWGSLRVLRACRHGAHARLRLIFSRAQRQMCRCECGAYVRSR